MTTSSPSSNNAVRAFQPNAAVRNNPPLVGFFDSAFKVLKDFIDQQEMGKPCAVFLP